jgi:RHS repeat-associated protein
MAMANRRTQGRRGWPDSITGGGSITAANALPGTNTQENWNLDGLGNWRSLTFTSPGGGPGTQQRSHNRLNQITEFGGRPFTYDGSPGASNGNLATDSFRAYQFDALNRQIQVIMAGSTTVLGNYVFDAFNRRIRKTISNGGFGGGIPNGTTDCIYLSNQVMEERNPFGGSGSTDTPIRQYIWGTYIDEQIQLTTLTTLGAQDVPAGTYYLLQDLLYRAVALTNSSGNIVEAYDTDAYGQTIIYTGPGADGVWFTDDDVGSGFTYGANDMIFCGYRYDPETRLYFVRNRIFLTDADGISVGRWMQRDPIGYAGGVNLYEYVGGRAAVEVDPMGEKYWTAYGPYGPAWDKWNHTCYVWFDLYANPSWYNYLWSENYGRMTKVLLWPLPGIMKNQCTPHAFRCADISLKAQIVVDLAEQALRGAIVETVHEMEFYELEQWGWAIAGGAAGGMSGEGAGQPGVTGVGGLHDIGAGGKPSCPAAPPKPGC